MRRRIESACVGVNCRIASTPNFRCSPTTLAEGAPAAWRTMKNSDHRPGSIDRSDPADVAAGLKNKMQAALAHVTPSGMPDEQHRKSAEPGTAEQH